MRTIRGILRVNVHGSFSPVVRPIVWQHLIGWIVSYAFSLLIRCFQRSVTVDVLQVRLQSATAGGRVSETRHKLANLTGIRAVAALWVVLFHFGTTEIVGSTLDGGILEARGGWGVDIFFVLSGLVLGLNYAVPFGNAIGDWSVVRGFIRKRFARLYPLHLATFATMALAWIAAHRLHMGFVSSAENTPTTAAYNLLLVHAWGLTSLLSWNQPSWSISAEWFAYILIFPICGWFLGRRTPSQCVVLALVLWAVFIVVLFLRYDGEIEHVTTQGVLRIIPEFVGGYAVYRVLADSASRRIGDLSTFSGLAIIVGIAYLPNVSVVLLMPSIMVLLMGLSCGGQFTDKVFGNRAMVFLGEISYSIYMTHLFVQIIFNQILRRIHVAETLVNGLVILSLEIGLSILIGYIGYIVIEVPARRALTKGTLGLTRADAQPTVA